MPSSLCLATLSFSVVMLITAWMGGSGASTKVSSEDGRPPALSFLTKRVSMSERDTPLVSGTKKNTRRHPKRPMIPWSAKMVGSPVRWVNAGNTFREVKAAKSLEEKNHMKLRTIEA